MLQRVRDKSKECAFHRATKFYLKHYLGHVENIVYPFGEGGIVQYSLYPVNDIEQIDFKIFNTKNPLLQIKTLFLTFVK